MRGTKAKKLRRLASKLAQETSEPSGLHGRVTKRIKTGKTDSMGKDIIIDKITARHSGFRRIYQALKKGI